MTTAQPAYPFKRTRVYAFERSSTGALSITDIVEFGGRTTLNVRTVKRWRHMRDADQLQIVRGILCLNENSDEEFLPRKTKIVQRKRTP